MGLSRRVDELVSPIFKTHADISPQNLALLTLSIAENIALRNLSLAERPRLHLLSYRRALCLWVRSSQRLGSTPARVVLFALVATPRALKLRRSRRVNEEAARQERTWCDGQDGGHSPALGNQRQSWSRRRCRSRAPSLPLPRRGRAVISARRRWRGRERGYLHILDSSLFLSLSPSQSTHIEHSFTRLFLSPKLQTIVFQSVLERSRKVVAFPPGPALRELCLSRLPRVDGDSLVALFGDQRGWSFRKRGKITLATTLRHLRLSDMSKLSFVHVKQLVLLSSLHSVELDAVPVNDAILWALARSRGKGARVLRIHNPRLLGASVFERDEAEVMGRNEISAAASAATRAAATAAAAPATAAPAKTGIDWADALLSRSRVELSARSKSLSSPEEEQKRKAGTLLFTAKPISAPPLLVLAGAMTDPWPRPREEEEKQKKKKEKKKKKKKKSGGEEHENTTRLVELTFHGARGRGRLPPHQSLCRAIALANESRAKQRGGLRHGDVWTSCFPELEGTSEPLLLERGRSSVARQRVVDKGKLSLLKRKLRSDVVQATRPPVSY